MLQKLKTIFGPKCTGIKINGDHFDWQTKEHMRFCEAVNISFENNLLINSDNISCAGAKRNLWEMLDDNQLADKISQNKGIDRKFVGKLLSQIPTLKKNPENFVLGNFDNPDLYVIYTTPDLGMHLTYLYAEKFSKSPIIAPIPILSICGSVFIQTFTKQKISLSFGCPESRKFGGLKKNEIIIGMPADIAKDFSLDDFEKPIDD